VRLDWERVACQGYPQAIQLKVMQRTDCRLMRVLFVPSIGGYHPHAPPVVTDRTLALSTPVAGANAFWGRLER
jgi:hypothetical protein